MDCAAFERTLAELLGEELDRASRDRRLQAMREHAAGCEACRGSDVLLELAAAPTGERDPLSDPGDAYWQGFEARVRARIDERPSAGRPGRAAWLVAAAAALAVIVLGGWVVLRSPEEAVAVAEQEAADPVRFPEELQRRLAAAPALSPEVDELDGWGMGLDSDTAGAFPDVSDLDGETQQELLRWLKEQAS